MRLVNKFTVWYLAITTLVLLLSGIIVFYNVQAEIEKEVTRRLKRDIDHAVRLLESEVPIDSVMAEHIAIKELAFDKALIPFSTFDSMVNYSPSLTRVFDRKFGVVSSYKIKDKHYYISAYNFIAEPDEILEGILFSLGLTLLILLLFVGIVSRMMSKQILAPFNQVLKAIQSFTLNQKGRIQLAATRTYEFRELNQFLEKMMGKAQEDYRSLKEFSENASHELQTPLAIIRGKLELLMETKIDEEQAAFIVSIQNSVQKLSAINQSLTLLTKLENQEYQAKNLDFSLLVNNTLAAFRELIEMKSILLTTKIEKVDINLNPVLADMLFTNLLSNAIQHNTINGSIEVILSPSALVIKNSGEAPKIPTSELFKRFKKNKQSSDSTGLGLAIVKQICDLNGLNVVYEYTDGVHTVKVIFGGGN
jgi:signal transduction histidine kinase